DAEHSDDEDRFLAIGPISRGVAVVAHVIRIISARMATPAEEELLCQHAGGASDEGRDSGAHCPHFVRAIPRRLRERLVVRASCSAPSPVPAAARAQVTCPGDTGAGLRLAPLPFPDPVATVRV